MDIVGCTSCDAALMRHLESYKAMKNRSVKNERMYRYTEGQRDVKYEIVIDMKLSANVRRNILHFQTTH